MIVKATNGACKLMATGADAWDLIVEAIEARKTAMLELYEIVEIAGKQYVRKERLDVLQQQFDDVCKAHTEFVDQVHAAMMNRTKKDEFREQQEPA